MKDEFGQDGIIDMEVTVYWGVKDIDVANVDRWDPHDMGKVVFDDGFDLAKESSQQSLYNFCMDLKDQEFVKDGEVNCWFLDFLEWYKQQAGDTATFPIAEQDFLGTLFAWTKTEAGNLAYSQNLIGFADNELVFTKVTAISIGNVLDSKEKKEPIFDQWEEYLRKFKDSAPEEMTSIKQNAKQYWGWMKMEDEFVNSAKQGAAIAMVFAFFMLLISTMNMVLAFFAIICVCIVIISVTFIIVTMDWQLGLSESICIVITVGLSVDYVVHLATDYSNSP